MTLSPTPLSPAETIQFDWGHTPVHAKPERIKIGDAYYLAVPKPKAREQLIEVIYGSLQNPGSVCLLENYLAEADDPWLQRAKSRVATNGSEVYHALLSVDRDESSIDTAIREWEGLPTSIGAAGSMNENASAHVAAEKTVTAGQLAAFAQASESVFVAAYEGEGYVVWEKRPR